MNMRFRGGNINWNTGCDVAFCLKVVYQRASCEGTGVMILFFTVQTVGAKLRYP